ncbi:hypothetical protein RIF29_14273 [Crotalaria pallida]|uniref:DUF4283 domain-containing protein n=1 Tax=Crotalaria pallida TaxID=3830 RepID=A0AAN9FBE8_CROPI
MEKKETVKEGNNVEFKPSKDCVEWLGKCFVGKLVNVEDVEKVQTKLCAVGLYNIKAMRMGGRCVLLEADDDCDVVECLQSNYTWFQGLFEEVKRWNPVVMVHERVIWVQCFGIPLVAWEERFFSLVATVPGSFIKLDDATTLKSRLDVGRMLILTSSKSFINMTVNVKINDQVYGITVVEEVMVDHVNFVSRKCFVSGDIDVEKEVSEGSISSSD